jgi:hypothetical protein
VSVATIHVVTKPVIESVTAKLDALALLLTEIGA